MNLIFLDIAGVLNTPDTWGRWLETVNGIKGLKAIDKDKVERLNQIVAATNAQVVISSMWRVGRTMDDLKALLEARGFVGTLHGKTEELSLAQRWLEIAQYLRPLDIDAYVILDDMMQAGFGHSNNFVNTDPAVGLTDADTEKAIKILGGSDAD